MPTYDYTCDACGHELEAFQTISAKPLRKCPECGKLKLRRLIGAGAGLIFKGSGFYITDYRSSDYTSKAEAEKKAASGGESSTASGKESGTASTDAKSAEKKDAGKNTQKSTTEKKSSGKGSEKKS